MKAVDIKLYPSLVFILKRKNAMFVRVIIVSIEISWAIGNSGRENKDNFEGLRSLDKRNFSKEGKLKSQNLLLVV